MNTNKNTNIILIELNNPFSLEAEATLELLSQAYLVLKTKSTEHILT